jgi:peptidoglycan/LPS O-acetylase OafA/YrhL
MLGAYGVACFFALSGFLLARPYIASLLTGAPLPSWRLFARDRFLRIYPLYAFLVVAMTACSAWLGVPGEHRAGLVDALAHLIFVFPYFRSTALTVDPPMWTMATDVQFYVALPLVMALCAFVAWRVRSPKAVIAAIIVAAIVASQVWRVSHVGAAQAAFADFGVRERIFLMLPGMFTAFGGGVLGALAWQSTSARFRRSSGVVALIGAVAFSWAALQPWPTGIVPYIIWNDVMAGIAASLLLFGGCAIFRSPMIENPVVRWAERLSYAVYLVHFFVLQNVERYIGLYSGYRFFLSLALIGYIASLAIALPLYWFVERPFLDMKTRLKRGVVGIRTSWDAHSDGTRTHVDRA